MNFRLLPLRLTSLLLAIAGWVPASGQTDAMSGIPMIVMEGVPFTDVIRNLASQTGQNIILDPRVSGKPVSIRWENISAAGALDRLLNEQGFMLVQNPATTVARIVGTNLHVKPVSVDQIFGDTNKIIGLVVFDYTPIEVAVGSLANQAGLAVEIDPKLSMPSRDSAGSFITPPMVSVRWQKIAAAQAFAALLDNYQLTATKDTTTGKFWIGRKGTSPASNEKPKLDK